MASTIPESGFSSFAQFARGMWRFVGNRRGVGLGLLLTFATLLEGVGLLLLLPLLGLVLGTSTGIGWLDSIIAAIVSVGGGGSRLAQLVPLLSLFAILMAIRSIVILNRDIAIADLQSGFVNDQRLRIVSLLAEARWHVVARLQHGRITHILGAEMQALGDAANLILLTLVSAALLLVQGLIILILSPMLALLILALLCIVAAGLKPVFRRSRELGTILTDTSLGLVTSTTHFLGGLKLALSQNLQGSFVSKFRSLLGEAQRNRVEFARQRALTQVILTAIPASIAALVILVGIGVMNTHPPLIIGFLLVLGRMAGPATRVQAYLQQIWHALPAYGAIRRLEAELDRADLPEAAGNEGAVLHGPVNFQQVSYWHGKGGTGDRVGGVFNIDLDISEGMFLGLTGSSGAGKTTLADLLVGLYPPLSGQIMVGGRELTGPMLAAWRERISYVSQDPFLFHDTVRNNLLWARTGATEADLWTALRSAGAEDLVRRMDAGLDTMVGERGTLVSGGERQRIALARALLRKPKLLVLDEATNAIDVAGEQEILARLARQEDRPAIVMIAHREASLQLCERIVELREGRIERIADVAAPRPTSAPRRSS